MKSLSRGGNPTAPRLPLYLSQFLSGMVGLTLGPLLDNIMRDLGIPLARGGLIATAFFFGGIIGLVVVNLTLARIPMKAILVSAATLEAVGLSAAASFSRGLWSFALIYLLVGLPGMALAAVPGMWVTFHLRDKAAWALNLVLLSSVIGMTLTPLTLGRLLAAGASWRVLLGGEAAVALLIAVVIALWPLEDVPGRESLRLRHLRAVISHNGVLVGAIGGAAFLYIGAEQSVNIWLPKFQIDIFGASAAAASLAVTLFWVGQIVGRVTSIPLSRRFAAARLLSVSAAGMALFIALLALAPNRDATLGFSFAAGLGSAACFSHISSYSSRFPHWHVGVVYSVSQTMAAVGGMVFPYMTGPLAAAAGFRAAIAVAAVPALAVAVMGFGLRRAAGEASVEWEGGQGCAGCGSGGEGS